MAWMMVLEELKKRHIYYRGNESIREADGQWRCWAMFRLYIYIYMLDEVPNKHFLFIPRRIYGL